LKFAPRKTVVDGGGNFTSCERHVRRTSCTPSIGARKACRVRPIHRGSTRAAGIFTIYSCTARGDGGAAGTSRLCDFRWMIKPRAFGTVGQRPGFGVAFCFVASFFAEAVEPHDFTAWTLVGRRCRRFGGRRQGIRLPAFGNRTGRGRRFLYLLRCRRPFGCVQGCRAVDGFKLEAELHRRIVEGRYRLERHG